MSRLHRQKMRQRFEAGAGAGNRDRDRAGDDVERVEARFAPGRGEVEAFVARGQAAQAAVDQVIATAKPKAKRAKRKAASARRRR